MAYVERLTVKNYRTLQEIVLDDLQPLNVVLGPNGCGKSTLFDVFGFLADCLSVGVRKALEPRGRLKQLRSRNSDGPVVIELKYRECAFDTPRQEKTPLITYRLEIDSPGGTPLVTREFLKWKRGSYGAPFHFLDLRDGKGEVITGEEPEMSDERKPIELDDPTKPAIATLGQLGENPRIASLRRYIDGWYLSYFIPDQARGLPEAGSDEHLSKTGQNLANVVQFLDERHPDLLKEILHRMSKRIPELEHVDAKRTVDGRLVLRFKDGPFEDPFLSNFVSDGTLKMFAYLILLMDPNPPPLLCIEEPENGLHPRLLTVLAEEFRAHARGAFSGQPSQVMVSSHSPYFIDALRPNELWIMERGDDGYATVKRADRLRGIPEFLESGANLGNLWYEGQFRRGNP